MVVVFGYMYEWIVSGVGYDVILFVCCFLIVMVFILCVDGLLYNEVEDVLFDDVMCGMNVLFYVVLVWVGIVVCVDVVVVVYGV